MSGSVDKTKVMQGYTRTWYYDLLARIYLYTCHVYKLAKVLELSYFHCVYRREAFVVTPNDVVVTDVAENIEEKVTFTMYVLVNDGFKVLHIDALEASVNVSRKHALPERDLSGL